MTLSGTRIAIIGAGIAGLSHAIALLRCGAEVTIFEQAGALTEVGAALQISENGAKALEALGVYDALAPSITRSPNLEIYDHTSTRPLLRLPFARLRPQYRQGRVLRWDLISALYEAACRLGAQVHFNTRVETADPAGQLIFSAGVAGQFDLILGADGVNSALRTVVNPEATPKFTGQIAWRALVPIQKAHPDLRVVLAPRRHLVIYDVAQYRNIVAVEESDTWAGHSWRQAGVPSDLRDVFSDLHAQWRGELTGVTTVHKWGLHTYENTPHIRNGRIVLVGDAAHPTLPFMAQGACLALEGAVILANALSLAGLERGAALFDAHHMPRARKIVAQAAKNGTSFHLPHGPKRMAAHAALRMADFTGGRAMIGRWDWIYGYDPTQVTLA